MNETKRNTLFNKNLSLSHFILERSTQFVVSLRDRWTYIYSERRLLLTLYLLPGARGCQRLHPLASRIVRDNTNASDRLRISGSNRFWLDWLTKSDRVVLISRGLLPGYTPARPAYPDTLPPPCLFITTWQLVKAHGVTRNEPKIHVNSHYITKQVWIFSENRIDIYDLFLIKMVVGHTKKII